MHAQLPLNLWAMRQVFIVVWLSYNYCAWVWSHAVWQNWMPGHICQTCRTCDIELSHVRQFVVHELHTQPVFASCSVVTTQPDSPNRKTACLCHCDQFFENYTDRCVLFFTFYCINDLRKLWLKCADMVVNSLWVSWLVSPVWQVPLLCIMMLLTSAK